MRANERKATKAEAPFRHVVGRPRKKAPFLLPAGEGNSRITPEVIARSRATLDAKAQLVADRLDLARRLEVDRAGPETEEEADRLDAVIEAAEPELEKLRAKFPKPLRRAMTRKSYRPRHSDHTQGSR